MDKNKKWMQNADIKKGALRNYVHRKYGEKGFTNEHNIRMSVLRDLKKMPGITGKRAGLALTYRRSKK